MILLIIVLTLILIGLMTVPDDIVLGDGVFGTGATSTSVTTFGLTRGGGNWTVEREFKLIEADGDYGPVKGRVRLIKEVAKLNVKDIEIVPSMGEDYYPSLSACATSGSTTSTWTSRSMTTNVSTDDYNYTQWTGYNKAGRQVLIALENAINLGNINWDLIDKNEIMQELVYTATYLETARNTVPWHVYFTTTSS